MKKWMVLIISLVLTNNLLAIGYVRQTAKIAQEKYSIIKRLFENFLIKKTTENTLQRYSNARNDISSKKVKSFLKELILDKKNYKETYPRFLKQYPNFDNNHNSNTHILFNNFFNPTILPTIYSLNQKQLPQFDIILENKKLEDFEKILEIQKLIDLFGLPLLDLLIFSNRLDLIMPLEQLGFKQLF